MCTGAIIGIAFPSVLIGVVICSMVFSIIIKRSERLTALMENGDESAYVLLHGYFASEPRRARSTVPVQTRKSGGTRAVPRNRAIIYDFSQERAKRMR